MQGRAKTSTVRGARKGSHSRQLPRPGDYHVDATLQARCKCGSFEGVITYDRHRFCGACAMELGRS